MKRDSTKVLWLVQIRRSRNHKWVNKGTFETREVARAKAERFRIGWYWQDLHDGTVVGFGNTRVVRHERAAQVVEVAK